MVVTNAKLEATSTEYRGKRNFKRAPVDKGTKYLYLF